MSRSFALFVGGAETDLGFTDDDGRSAVGFDCFSEGGIALGDVVCIVAADDTPVVGGKTGSAIL